MYSSLNNNLTLVSYVFSYLTNFLTLENKFVGKDNWWNIISIQYCKTFWDNKFCNRFYFHKSNSRREVHPNCKHENIWRLLSIKENLLELSKVTNHSHMLKPKLLAKNNRNKKCILLGCFFFLNHKSLMGYILKPWIILPLLNETSKRAQ